VRLRQQQELNAMKAPSEYPGPMGGPFAAVFVALGGALVVAGAMLLVGVRHISLSRYVPDFAMLQSLVG